MIECMQNIPFYRVKKGGDDMTNTNNLQGVINNYITAIYKTTNTNWYEQSKTRQSIAYELAGEILKIYEKRG